MPRPPDSAHPRGPPGCHCSHKNSFLYLLNKISESSLGGHRANTFLWKGPAFFHLLSGTDRTGVHLGTRRAASALKAPRSPASRRLGPPRLQQRAVSPRQHGRWEASARSPRQTRGAWGPTGPTGPRSRPRAAPPCRPCSGLPSALADLTPGCSGLLVIITAARKPGNKLNPAAPRAFVSRSERGRRSAQPCCHGDAAASPWRRSWTTPRRLGWSRSRS